MRQCGNRENWAGSVQTRDKKRDRSQSFDIVSTKQAVIGGLLLVCSAVLAIVGPFNTFGMGDFWWRFLYWGSLVLTSVVLASFVQIGVIRLLPKPIVVREGVTILVFSLLFTPIVVLWTELVLFDPNDAVPSAVRMFVYILAICIGISAVRYGGPELMQAMMPEQDPAPPPPPRLIRRLPEGVFGEVLRLSGDGHYVNVLTTGGVFDVRIRLSDAVDEMDTVEGLWVHRSHWVVRSAISHSEKVRGRPVLVLVTGETVPVGAKFRDQLEIAGIL